MKTNLITFCTALIITLSAFANDKPKYRYFLDLTQTKDDMVKVQLIVPDVEQETIIFSLPKIIPGTYKIADYGRFVEDLKALDKKGRELEVLQIDKNSWEIQNAQKLVKITYWVNDTYDTDLREDPIYPMAGTNIEDGKNYVINTPGYFGYFQGMKEVEFELNILRPESLYGSTGMIQSEEITEEKKLEKEFNYVSDNAVIDHFLTVDYNQLIDSPLMYCKPDTTLVRVADTEVLVSVFSPGDNVSSQYVADNLEEILYAQKEYLGGTLPVDKYAFILYCEEWNKLAPVQGALEHSYSSFYYLPDVPEQHLLGAIRDAGAHEFFHIVTPLTIHSEEIENFNFNQPEMSEHLWLYEGVTEYFAGNVQVKYDIISKQEYLQVLQNKISAAASNYNDELSFTDLSKYTLDRYPEQYGNVYQKGALIGMCLDLILLKESNGEYGLQNLILELSERYGINRSFKDEELFDVIEELTFPSVRTFLDKYVREGGVLPYNEVFGYAGVEFQKASTKKDYSFGSFGLGVDPETQKLFISNVSNLNEFGKSMDYKEGDIITHINGSEMPTVLTEIQPFFDEARDGMKEGDTLRITVLRENSEGEKESVELSSEIFKVEMKEENKIAFIPEPTEDQLQIRKAWLEPRDLSK